MRFKIFVAGFANFLWNDVVTHFPVRFIRKGFLRLFNRGISPSAVILMHTRILNFWNVDIGDRSVINQYVLLDCRKYKVRIHHDVDIGPYSRVWTLGHSPESPTHETVGGEVVISNHVWIASGVTILPNVIIEAGAVVGSGSLVSRNIPSCEVWAGNPARFIRKRVNDLKYALKYNPYFE